MSKIVNRQGDNLEAIKHDPQFNTFLDHLLNEFDGVDQKPVRPTNIIYDPKDDHRQHLSFYNDAEGLIEGHRAHFVEPERIGRPDFAHPHEIDRVVSAPERPVNLVNAPGRPSNIVDQPQRPTNDIFQPQRPGFRKP